MSVFDYFNEFAIAHNPFHESIHGEEPFFSSHPFGSDNSTESEPFAALCAVLDCNCVDRGIPFHYVGTGHLTFTFVVNNKLIGLSRRFLSPSIYAFGGIHNIARERNGRTAGVIEFMDMVDLLHRGMISGEFIHHAGQEGVESEKDVHSNAEI